MLNIFKKTNKSSPILVDCTSESIQINGQNIEFPAHMNTLTELFGEPSRKEHDLLWRVVWDDLGIFTEYGTWDNVLDVKFLVGNNHQVKNAPNNFFTGQIKVDGLEIQPTGSEDIELHKHKVRIFAYKGETSPYAISVGMNFNYKEEIPKDKYEIKPLDEEVIEFKDFGFKLSIIQELMYTKELLKPKFDLYEFVEWYDKREIDLEEEGYYPIPEVTQYFKDLPIPKRLASEVEEIYQDGGNDIYMQLIRFAEGYEDYWDIESIEDLKHFPNLKKATLCYAKDHILSELKEKGVDAEWI